MIQNVIVRTRQTHPVIRLVALAAYLLNLAAAAGGAVLCQDPVGEASIELACDHDHCTATVEVEHDHDFGGCWCFSCPCDDTSLVMDVALVLRDDDVRAGARNVLTITVPHFETVQRPAHQALRADRPPPGLGRSLRQLRTVVLIV